MRQCVSLLLARTSGTGGGDLGGGHQVPDILLQELVIGIELIVFFLDGFDAVEDFEEGFVEFLCMSVE